MPKPLLLPNILPVKWSVTDNVTAVTTTRNGGCSTRPFNSFNLGDHVGDKREFVNQNRKILAKTLDCTANIQWLNQVHGGTAIAFTSLTETPPNADAAYTSSPNLPLAILTADCLPILLANSDGTEIAAIHGGWRPLAANVIANTLLHFKSKTEKVHAWLGPCIGPTAFEVGPEVFELFTQIDHLLANAFIQQKNGKYVADLHFIASYFLRDLGVNHINRLGDCTYLNKDRYFSYRRDGTTGRMATVITILR